MEIIQKVFLFFYSNKKLALFLIIISASIYGPHHEKKPSCGLVTWQDRDQPAQLQRLVGIREVCTVNSEFFYGFCENKTHAK